MALTLKRVLISDEVDDKCVNILKDNGIEAVKNTKLTSEQLIAEIPVSWTRPLWREYGLSTVNIICVQNIMYGLDLEYSIYTNLWYKPKYEC